MDINGDVLIPAPQAKVWAGLNDAEILKRCIPGCDSLAWAGENRLEAQVSLKVGPVSAKFGGAVTLSDIDAPNGYTISGEGKGGAAGFAKGEAKVSLTSEAGGTRLSYATHASVGGKLAQIGSRMIQGTATKLADEFFTRFAEAVAEPIPEPSPAPVPEAIAEAGAVAEAGPAEQSAQPEQSPSEPAADAPPAKNVHWWIAVGLAVVAAIILLAKR